MEFSRKIKKNDIETEYHNEIINDNVNSEVNSLKANKANQADLNAVQTTAMALQKSTQIPAKKTTLVLELGNHVSTTGLPALSTTRARTINKEWYDAGTVFSIATGYEFSLRFYDTDGTYTGYGNTLWLKNYTLNQGSYIHINIRKATDGTITVAEVAESMSITKNVPAIIKNIDTLDLELGNYTSDAGIAAISTTRVRTKVKKFYKAGTIFEIASGYHFSLRLYRGDGTYLGYSKPSNVGVATWNNYYVLRESCFVHINIRKSADGAITVSEAINVMKITENSLYAEQNQIRLTGAFNTYYSSADFPLVNFAAITAEQYRALWDALVTAYPNRISKRVVGYPVHNSDGSDWVEQPLMGYTIKPPLYGQTFDLTYDNYSTQRTIEVPKIIISSGVHGNEKAAPYALYQFVKQMLELHDTNECMQSIGNNVMFDIIPVVCTLGYDAGYGLNTRGVNINRNFSYNWYNQTTGDPAQMGTGPLSERESQLYSTWLAANKDAVLHIDFHTTLSNLCTYINTQDIFIQKMFSHLIRTFNSKWKTSYNYDLTSQAPTFSFINSGWNASTTNEARFVHGIRHSTILEFSPKDQGIEAKTEYTLNVEKVGVELLTNFILHYLNACRV